MTFKIEEIGDMQKAYQKKRKSFKLNLRVGYSKRVKEGKN